MYKLDIAQMFEEGWGLLCQSPVVLILVGINTVCFMLSGMYPFVVVIIAVLVLNFILYFLATQYAYEVVLGNPTWKAVFHFMGPKWIPLFLAVAGWMVFTMLGLIALVIPGLWIMIRLCMCDYAVIFDHKNVMDSYKESWRLTEGSFWRISLILLVLYLPYIIAELLPKTNQFLIVKFLLMAFSQAWTLTTMLRVYLKLKDIKSIQS